MLDASLNTARCQLKSKIIVSVEIDCETFSTGKRVAFDLEYLIVLLNAINEDETILEPDERL